MSNETKSLYEFGKFRFNTKTNTLWREGELISLSPKALELLKLLIEKDGEVVSKQEIFETVWANTFVEDGVLTQNIYTLRQVLGVDEKGKQLIENLARRGYRLIVPVKLVEPEKEVLAANKPQFSETKTAQNKHPNFLYFAIPLALISLFGYFGYRYFSANTPGEAKQNPIQNLKFKQLTDTGDASYLTISPDGNSVAYTKGSEIFLQNLQNNQETKIPLENQKKIGCLQFSADGKFVYFGTLFNRDEKGSIYRVPIAGGTPEAVAENVWSGFSLSPNGKELAFVRKIPAENKQELIVKNLETNADKSLKNLNLPEEFYWNNYPAWSPDGKNIAMVAVTQNEHFSRILTIDENGNSAELKPNNFRNIEQIVWNADGKSFIAAANDGSNFQLWKISFDGNSQRVTNDLNSYLGIAVSADRAKLVSRQRIYFSNIWTANKDDLNNLKQVTNGTSRNDGLNGLTWLDEEKIVYSTNDEKIRDWNLWLLNTADGTKQKLTNDSETQNDYPVISPDKKTIYFASDRNKSSRIWSINTDGSNPQQITFGEDETHHFPQVSPDGKHLFFIIKSGRNSNIGRKSLAENSVQELSGKINYVVGNFLALSPDGKFLAFQNINDKNLADSKLEIGILSTENPENVQFKEVEAWRQRIEWSPIGDFLEYVSGNVKQSAIMRQSLQENSQPEKIFNSSDAIIFNFAWSPSGEKLAVSRGQLLRDVVLLNGF